MKKEIKVAELQDFIEELKNSGFRVFQNKADATWVIFTKDGKLGYVDMNDRDHGDQQATAGEFKLPYWIIHYSPSISSLTFLNIHHSSQSTATIRARNTRNGEY